MLSGTRPRPAPRPCGSCAGHSKDLQGLQGARTCAAAPPWPCDGRFVFNDTPRFLLPRPQDATSVHVEGAKRTRSVARTRLALPVVLAVNT
jgi:hypothetical protein